MRLKFGLKTSDLRGMEKVTLDKSKEVLFQAMVKMESLAVKNAVVDTGRLRNSIFLNPTIKGATEYTLGVGVKYGSDVEYGTSPHMVGAEALKGWSKRVLGDENAAYAVARKISKFGTDAQPFMRPALSEVENIWLPAIKNRVFG